MHKRGACVLCRYGHQVTRPDVSSNRLWAVTRSYTSSSSRPAHEGRRSRAPSYKSLSRSSFAQKRGKDYEPNNANRRAPWRSTRSFKKPFHAALKETLGSIKVPLSQSPMAQYLEKEGTQFDEVWADYVRHCSARSSVGTQTPSFANKLATAYGSLDGAADLTTMLKRGFYAYATGLRFTDLDIENQKDVADVRYPSEWYADTRKMQRKIHLHVGPTNSGKTYHALRSMELSSRGLYAGPLRLLAHEVYTRLNSKGKRCALITGEEQRYPDGVAMDSVSCTVEMADLATPMSVAVIDEIQMIGDPSRGFAWTAAFLGIMAEEVHLCGETRVVPLIKSLAASLGEELIVHNYERLSPLKMDDKSLNGDLRLLRPGDCIVAFSVRDIHPLRKEIETVTGRKVATVYGGLPPETRAQQARLFNDPDNDYDFLVASDAIGMGLNLSIKRIIFETTTKFNGSEFVTLDAASIKQIAGRAGRYKNTQAVVEDIAVTKEEHVADLPEHSNHTDPPESPQEPEDLEPAWVPGMWDNKKVLPDPFKSSYEAAVLADNPGADPSKPTRPPPNDPSNFGLVTTIDAIDFPIVSQALASEPAPLEYAYVSFPPHVVARFAQNFPPGTPFSSILMRMNELARMGGHYRLGVHKDELWIADIIEPIQGISISDRYTMCSAPASTRDAALWVGLLPEMARCVEQQSGGALYELEHMTLELMELPYRANYEILRQYERLHKSITMYLWLSFRFAGIFVSRPLANEVKKEVESRISTILEGLGVQEQAKWKQRMRGRKLEIKEKLDEVPTGVHDEIASAASHVIPVSEETGELDVDGDGQPAAEVVETMDSEPETPPAVFHGEVRGSDGQAEQSSPQQHPMQIPKHLHTALDPNGAKEVGEDTATRT